jgi:hypothetical protein
MRRRSTLLTLPGLAILVILIASLGLTLWRKGGLAFSPGDLSSQTLNDKQIAGFKSHAEFEGQCSLCHQPFSSIQAELCTACHVSVGEQITMEDSLHGMLDNVMRCAECHSDHQGREFDLRLGNLMDFNHSQVKFSLIWHQVDYSMASIDCLDCHITDDRFSVSTLSCSNCHAGHDSQFAATHLADFGDDCVACHDGLDSMARFDHASVGFQLVGYHLEIECVDCHLEGRFQDLPGDCISCHAEPPEHFGIFGHDCADCHNSNSWKPALFEEKPFDHNRDTRFSLVLHAQDYSGELINCASCHVDGIDEFQPASCSDCHALGDQAFITQHQAQIGGNCLECHDGADRMWDFDHQNVFKLDGRHVELDCLNCHVDQRFQNTPAECKDCHPEPEIHAGFFGDKCEYCHSTISWYPALLVNHQFPIDHGDEGQQECQVCHVATYSEYSCYECHEHPIDEIQDKHEELYLSTIQLADCTECHLDGQVHEVSD